MFSSQKIVVFYKAPVSSPFILENNIQLAQIPSPLPWTLVVEGKVLYNRAAKHLAKEGSTMDEQQLKERLFAVGSLPKGPRNKLSDVPGVTVGHCSLRDQRLNTGVTVILPGEENPFVSKLPAAAFVWNGFGKSCGLAQIQELGNLETPIALTNTLNVGKVSDALVDYMLRRCQAEGVDCRSLNPVVGECNDSSLSDISLRAVGSKEVFSAIESATADFEEGAVGAGCGTICHGLKGGIGSSSRLVNLDGKDYTLGVLVQSNYGRLSDLMVHGQPLGQRILARQKLEDDSQDKGSIMMIVATDLPLSSRQLQRVIKRCSVGLARLGSYVGHGSGEFMIGFSTANRQPLLSDTALLSGTYLHESRMDLCFRAAAEATEEAVLHSLYYAQSTWGYKGDLRRSLREYLDLLD